ncbi:MAG: glycosyltransferase family 4 protein [Planctomycetota bacterium]|nr:MAG: glycosyltransferase family 4 protein [Planctomycetota bacterium]
MTKLLILTPAFPEKKAPYKTRFIQEMAETLAAPPTPWNQVEVLAPSVLGGPLCPNSAIRLRSFHYFSGKKRLKDFKVFPLVPALSFLGSAILATLEASKNIDFILAHWLFPMGPVAYLVSRMCHIPYGIYIHGSDYYRYGPHRPFWKTGAKNILQNARHIWVTNSEIQEGVQKIIEPTKVSHLPCGVHSLFFQGKSYSLPSNLGRILLYVGDLEEAKGVSLLLEIATLLAKKEKNLKWILVGQGSRYHWLNQESKKRGLGSLFSVTGPLPPQEIQELLSMASLFVFPSRSEGCPVAVMEALAMAVPVIGSKLRGIEDLLLSEQQGKILPHFKADLWAEAILSYLNKSSLQKDKDKRFFNLSPHIRTWKEWKKEFLASF